MDKQFILSEIKRTAEANGGVPMGRDRFSQETGIRSNDWEGKLWARWGDAVRDAGFEPNAMTSAYAADDLIHTLIALIRELGHFPVAQELKLRARNDPNFPDPKTFRTRFGNKARLVETIQNFCADRPEYTDVMSICSEIVPPRIGVTERDTVDSIIIFGFVYLIRAGRSYKIGRTNSVGRRERELVVKIRRRSPDKTAEGRAGRGRSEGSICLILSTSNSIAGKV
jgi:hypothetical protein